MARATTMGNNPKIQQRNDIDGTRNIHCKANTTPKRQGAKNCDKNTRRNKHTHKNQQREIKTIKEKGGSRNRKRQHGPTDNASAKKNKTHNRTTPDKKTPRNKRNADKTNNK